MDFTASFSNKGHHSHSPVMQFDSDESQGKDYDTGQNMLLAWIILQLAGQVTLPILIVTLLFHKRIARRNPTVINLCIVWTLATIPPELLFYVGKYKGPMPGVMLCLFQAATITAVPPMAAMAYLSVVIHACTVIHEIINASTVRPFTLDLRMILLLSSPYVTFLTFALLIAIIGSENPHDVQRQLFFCEVRNHGLSVPVFAFTVIVVVFTLISQFYIAIMFYRNYLAKRKQKLTKGYTKGYTPSSPREVSALDIQLLIRMVAFTIFEIVIIVSSVASMFNPRLGAAKLMLATPPFAVFLIFASSKDICSAWFPCLFRRKSRSFERLPPLEPQWEDAHPKKHDSTPRPPSVASRYSQISLPAPAPAKMRDPRPSPPAVPDRDVDLEKGIVTQEQLRVDIPRTGAAQPHEVSTTTTVVQRSNSSSPKSPLEAIRALRTVPIPPRTKPRFNQI